MSLFSENPDICYLRKPYSEHEPTIILLFASGAGLT